MIETLTIDGGSAPSPITPRFRFQLDNHLGTVGVEVDDAGAVISYEEYFPYGTSAYRAMASGVEVSARRYRYTGKERDEETGLYLMGARYYVAWLARWSAADPAGTVDGTNLYAYVRGSPVGLVDPSGTQSHSPDLSHHVIWGDPEPAPEASGQDELGETKISGVGVKDIGEGGPGLETPGAGSVTPSKPGEVVPFDPYAEPGGVAPNVFFDPNAHDWIDSFILRNGEALQDAVTTVAGLALTIAFFVPTTLAGALGLLARETAEAAFLPEENHDPIDKAMAEAGVPLLPPPGALLRKRLPQKSGSWTGKKGNSAWQSTDPRVNEITGGEAIPFKNERPDFRKWSKGELRFKAGELDGSAADFTRVYERIAKNQGLKNPTAAKKWLRRQGLTPHHRGGTTTVIDLVPSKLHNNVPHVGSASELRGRN